MLLILKKHHWSTFLFERYSLYVMKNNSLRRAYTHTSLAAYKAKVQISDNQLTDSFDLGITKP